MVLPLQLIAGFVLVGSFYYLYRSFDTVQDAEDTSKLDALSMAIDPTKYKDSAEPDPYDENQQRNYEKPTKRRPDQLDKKDRTTWLDTQSALVQASKDYQFRTKDEITGREPLQTFGYEHDPNWDPVNREY
jgi:hypothetical protein